MRYPLLLAALLAAACGRDHPRPRRPAHTMSDNPSLRLIAPAHVKTGEPVPIALQVTNTGDRPVELHLLGRDIAFDITVTGEDGGVVWRRLEGATLLGILQLKVLAPGDTLELRDVWDQRTTGGRAAAPGGYTVEGIVPTDGEPLRTPPLRLRITEPSR